MPKTLAQIKEIAGHIKLVIFDVDGVLTDGTLSYGPAGEEIKHFNVKDGLGIKRLLKHGVEVAIITARQSDALNRRVKDLGITHFFSKVANKHSVYSQLIQHLGISAQYVAYLGDDVIDLPVMHLVGLSCTVSDGHFLVKEDADWITQCPGGHGAARELVDLILTSKMPIRDAYADLISPESTH